MENLNALDPFSYSKCLQRYTIGVLVFILVLVAAIIIVSLIIFWEKHVNLVPF